MIEILFEIEAWLSIRENIERVMIIGVITLPFIAYLYELARVKIVDFLFYKELQRRLVTGLTDKEIENLTAFRQAMEAGSKEIAKSEREIKEQKE